MRILLDVDGVLADFHSKALLEISQMSGIPLDPKHYLCWNILDCVEPQYKARVHHSWAEPGWCSSIPVMSGAQYGVQKLREKADVFFVTAQMTHSPYWMWERSQWLKKYFQATDEEIVFTVSKHVVTGDVLVDDKPENIRAWSQAHPNGKALLWDQPYNRDFSWANRISNLDAVI